MMMGDSKRNGGASATLQSPDNPHENHVPAGCLVITPPFTSESISVDMSPPKRRKLCKAPSPTPRVLFDEIFSSQLDLAHVPEDEFFLVKPKDTQAPAPLQLLRPCAYRGSEPYSKTPSSSSACPTPPSLFITIDEDAEDDSDSEELTCFDMSSSCFSASLNLIDEELINELRSPGRLSRFPNCTGRNSLDEGPAYNEPQTRLSECPRIRLKPRPVSL